MLIHVATAVPLANKRMLSPLQTLTLSPLNLCIRLLQVKLIFSLFVEKFHLYILNGYRIYVDIMTGEKLSSI